MNDSSQENMTIEYDKILKEALFSAFIMLGLTISMIGFHIIDIPGGLKLGHRVFAVGFVTVLAFVIRFVLLLQERGKPWPVVIVGGGLAIALLISIMAGFSSDGQASIWLPFGDVIVNWILFLFLAVVAVRGLLELYKSGLVQYSSAKVEKQKEAGLSDGNEKGNTLGAFVQKNAKYIAPAFLGVAIIAPLFAYTPEEYRWMDRRLIDVAVLVITYIMLGWGLNIVVGLAGLLDLGYVAFYAVGAYSYALLSTTYGVSFWVALPFAGLVAATFGLLLGFPVLRLRGDYLAIVTLGFGEIIRVVLLNWYDFTNGPDGISGIARPTFFGLEFVKNAPEGVETFHTFFNLEYASIDKVVFLYYLILILALLTNWFTIRIRRLPIGRAWEALREDEIACRSLGINPTNTKLTAFAIGAMFGGFAGSFFATRQGFISPESFTFIESAIILAVVVLGGMGSQIGIVLAAILLIGLPEFFREMQQFRMLAFGGAMVLIMLWRPSGLLAYREPTIRLLSGVGEKISKGRG